MEKRETVTCLFTSPRGRKRAVNLTNIVLLYNTRSAKADTMYIFGTNRIRLESNGRDESDVGGHRNDTGDRTNTFFSYKYMNTYII